jgi:hypothetical protein
MTATSPQSPARLVIHRGAARTTISAAPGLDRLAELSFTGRQPDVDVTSDTVRITYPLLGFPSLRARGAGIVLHAGHSWAVEIDGGAGELAARLDTTAIRSVHVDGGMARSTLVLPPAAEVVPVTITSGVSRVALRLPRGTAFELDIKGGVKDLVLDEQVLGAVGGRVRLRSPGLFDRDRHYRITVGGGASGLSVTSGARLVAPARPDGGSVA